MPQTFCVPIMIILHFIIYYLIRFFFLRKAKYVDQTDPEFDTSLFKPDKDHHYYSIKFFIP